MTTHRIKPSAICIVFISVFRRKFVSFFGRCAIMVNSAHYCRSRHAADWGLVMGFRRVAVAMHRPILRFILLPPAGLATGEQLIMAEKVADGGRSVLSSISTTCVMTAFWVLYVFESLSAVKTTSKNKSQGWLRVQHNGFRPVNFLTCSVLVIAP